MRVAWAALAATMLLPMAAMGADAPRALAAPRARIESADYRASGHLVRVDANGARVSYPITIKAHWFPGVLRVKLEIANAPKTGPDSLVIVRILTHMFCWRCGPAGRVRFC
jgi:hypothetical protein